MTKRVALVGNCQVWGLAASLRLQCPEVDFDDVFVGDIKTPEEGDDFAGRLGDYDLVLYHPQDNERLGALRSGRIEQATRALVRLPKVWFTGFHPDVVVIPEKQLAVPGFGDHHSRLIGGAFVAGIEEGRVPDLFNGYVYARLGFFDEYVKARAYMAMALAETKLEPEPLLAEWERQGVFMHTPNHPTIQTLWTLARAIGERLGLGPREMAERPADRLTDYRRWPVYPDLARRFGVPPELTFQARKNQPRASLEEFVAASYARYRIRREQIMVHPDLMRAAEILRAEMVGPL